MAVYQEKDKGTWRVVFRYTDFTGERKQTQKRGFKTKREATAWEHEMMLRKGNKLDMTFESFYEIYSEYKRQRVKESTFETKSHIVRTKILPYFGKRKINEITVADVIAWQNEMMAYRDEKGKPYSVDYLKTIQAQLTAIFNHAVNYYNLPSNPARQAGSMGKEVPKEMKFWTKEQYLKFAEAMMDKPRSYYAFEMLYWTGIREGELLALTPADFDFEKQTVRINKTYHRMKKQDIITSPTVSPLVTQISWTNHLLIMSGCKSDEEREFYIKLCIKESYFKRELERQIDSGYYERYMLSKEKLLPEPIKGLKENPFLDSYVIEFLDLPKNFKESDLRKGLIQNMKDFILEVGKDFTFIDEEYRVQVGGEDFRIDLLFFHRGLQCLVAFELKIGKFKPEYISKMDFYLEALDRQKKKENENPSVGMILCASKDDEVVEYAMSRTLSPMMVSFSVKLLYSLKKTHRSIRYEDKSDC